MFDFAINNSGFIVFSLWALVSELVIDVKVFSIGAQVVTVEVGMHGAQHFVSFVYESVSY